MDTPVQNQYKILLAGESCIDEYHYGRCDRISPEAPVPIFDLERTEIKDGMIRNVANNLKALGAVNIDVFTNNPHAILKTRYVDVVSKQQLLRVDREDRGGLCAHSFYRLGNDYSAVVISDYDKGLFTSEELATVMRRGRQDCPIFVDSKRRDLSVFENCYIKINEKERSLITALPDKYNLIVTHGGGGASFNGVRYTAPNVDVFDVTGAGDVFLATLAYSFLTTNDLFGSIKRATHLATKSVAHRGTYTLTKEDIDEVRN